MNGSTLNSLQLFCSASLTFQLWRSWHALGSMTRQLHVDPPAHSPSHPHPSHALSTDLQSEVQAPPRRLKTTCRFRSFVTDHSSSRPPACHSRPITLICFLPFCFLGRHSAAANSSIQLQVKSYLPLSLPNMLFALQPNKSHCTLSLADLNRYI